MQLVMVARETHLCSWIRLCSPCFILSHIMNILKWFSTELSYGECTAYRGSKCLDVSCVCVFFYFGTSETAQGISLWCWRTAVFLAQSEFFRLRSGGGEERHFHKTLSTTFAHLLVSETTELFNSYEVLDSSTTANLFTVVGSSLARTKSRQVSEPHEVRAPPMTLDCPFFQELSLDWPGWKPDSNVCIKQWHLCNILQ